MSPAAVLLAALLTSPAAAPSPPAAPAPARPAPPGIIAALAFLAGRWETEGGEAVFEEHWMEPRAGSMIGMSRTVAGGKTVFFEYLRIEERPDGTVYVAHPAARVPGTEFRLTRVGPAEVRFENPAHDHPKVIRYARDGDWLLATVEGEEKGKPRREEFRFRRR